MVHAVPFKKVPKNLHVNVCAQEMMKTAKLAIILTFIYFYYCDHNVVMLIHRQDNVTATPKSESGLFGKNLSATIKVTTSNGEIEGVLYTSGNHLKAFVFLGVPYAEPPTGELRFAKPVPKQSWNGTILCHDFKSSCPQSREFNFGMKLEQSEDCLYLNVFVSERCFNKKSLVGPNGTCPVGYYVHGGANEFGSPVTYSIDGLVDNFVSKDIIVVTIAHRLGIFGFWSTGTEEAIGNWALQDIIAGARWIQQDIGHFGGDPSKVTIMGYSSSSALVSVLTVTPETTGLFSQAAMMSGTGHRGYLLMNDLTNYWLLVNKVGCGSASSINDTIDCMRRVPVKKLVEEFNALRGFNSHSLDLPLNVTMPRNDGPNGLFPKPIDQMIQERRPLVVITGTNNNEDGLDKVLKYRNAAWRTTADLCRSLVDDTGYLKKRRIAEACVEQYVHSVNFSEFRGSRFGFWTEKVVQLNEDFEYFSLCYKEAATITKNGGRAYLYSFDYAKAGLEDIATFHAMDMTYLIDPVSHTWNVNDREVHNRYVSLFANFIKYGTPTPESLDDVIWDPLANDSSTYNYLSINNPIRMKQGYHKSGVIFWNQLVPRLEKFGGPIMTTMLKKSGTPTKDDDVIIRQEYFDELQEQQMQGDTENEGSTRLEKWVLARSVLLIMAYILVAMIFLTLLLVIFAVIFTEFCMNHRSSYERIN